METTPNKQVKPCETFVVPVSVKLLYVLLLYRNWMKTHKITLTVLVESNVLLLSSSIVTVYLFFQPSTICRHSPADRRWPSNMVTVQSPSTSLNGDRLNTTELTTIHLQGLPWNDGKQKLFQIPWKLPLPVSSCFKTMNYS